MIFDLSAARKTNPSNPYGGYGNNLYLGQRPVAGVTVTAETALTCSAVWGCTKIISESIGMLPWRVLQRDGSNKILDPKHPADDILHFQPNDEMTPMSFRETLIAHGLNEGNGYAEIESTRGGDPYALWPITPDRVNPARDSHGKLVYEISQGAGPNTYLKPEQIFHLKGMGFDGTVGYSVISMARESISMALAVEQYGASFFGNSAIPSGIIEQASESGEALSEDAIKNLLKTFNKKNRGARKANNTEFLDAGLTYKVLGIKPNEAQFLESRVFQIKEICRWYRMQPHKLADLERATHNNIEAENIEHVVDTLMPWAIRLEQEANIKLFKKSGGRRNYSKINLTALLRGDSKARAEFYKILMAAGVYDIDEVRLLEDMNTLPDGNGKVRTIPMNMTTVEQFKKSGGDQKPIKDRRSDAQRAVAMDVSRRMCRLETKRVESIAKKESAATGLREFYDQFGGMVSEAMTPLSHVVCQAIDGADVPSMDDFGKSWAEQSSLVVCTAIAEEKLTPMLKSWEPSRSQSMAEAAITYIMKKVEENV